MASRAQTLDALRRSNAAAVLTHLRADGPLTQGELHRRTGLSRTTVSTIVAELQERGWLSPAVRGAATPDGTPGQRQPLRFNADAARTIGVAVDGGQIRLALANLDHEVSAEHRIDTTDLHDADHVADALAAEVNHLIRSAQLSTDQLVGVGIAMPSPMEDAQRTVTRTGPFAGWNGHRIEEEMQRRLGYDVRVGNDADLGALAELTSGAGRGATNLMYVLTTGGVGAGLVLDRRIHTGSHASAGEIGHVVVERTGEFCHCGNRGCLQTIAGGDAVERVINRLTGEGLPITEIAHRAANGDRLCARVVGEAGRAMGQVLAMAVAVVDVDRVVIGGSLLPASEVLLPPLRAELDRGMVASAAHVDVVPAELGDRARLLGSMAILPVDLAERSNRNVRSVPGEQS